MKIDTDTHKRIIDLLPSFAQLRSIVRLIRRNGTPKEMVHGYKGEYVGLWYSFGFIGIERDGYAHM